MGVTMNTVTVKIGDFLFIYKDTSYTFMLKYYDILTKNGDLQERERKIGMNYLYCADIIQHTKTGKKFKNRFGPHDEFTSKQINELYSQVSSQWKTAI